MEGLIFGGADPYRLHPTRPRMRGAHHSLGPPETPVMGDRNVAEASPCSLIGLPPDLAIVRGQDDRSTVDQHR
jgi:hypothetical protein